MLVLSDPPQIAPRFGGGIACVATPALVCSTVCLATDRDPPEGLRVGRWILAPYLSTDYEADDNIFRRADSESPESDRISTLTAGLSASMPFKMSMLKLDYEGSDLNYSDHVFSRSVSHEASAELDLKFGSHDRLVLRDRLVRSFADVTNIDEGAELVFDGQPYDLNRWEVELSRNVPRRQGYQLRISRSDLIFDPDTGEAVPFFDYRGFDSFFEYRRPFSRQAWMTGSYHRRRFDHYAPQGSSTQLSDCATGVGVVCRREITDAIEIGLRGRLAKGQPYFVRLGYGELGYEFPNGPRPENASDFNGVVGIANWRFMLAKRTHLDISAQRRPLPSGFDTFYINNALRTTWSRSWLSAYRVDVNLAVAVNEYGDPIQLSGCDIASRGEDFRRRDRRGEIGGAVRWTPHPRLGLKLNVRHERRRSNCDTTEFDATAVTMGVTLGWF